MASIKRLPSCRCRRGTQVEKRRQREQGQASKNLTRLVRRWIAIIAVCAVCPAFDPSSSHAQLPFFRTASFQADEPSTAAEGVAEVKSNLDINAAASPDSQELVKPATNDPTANDPAANDPAVTSPATDNTAAGSEATNKPAASTVNGDPKLQAVEDVTAELLQSDELKLADVVASVYQSFPVVLQAQLERARARGLVTEAFGAYDTKLEAYTLNEPIGFYQNFRQGIGIARQNWWGTYLSAGYRIGRGVYEPWYLERETNKAGEFKVALGVPLLQGRAIDPQRVAVFQANLDRQAAEPQIQQAILDVSRDAARHYWDWVAVGAVLAAQKELLDLAVTRGEQFEVGFQAGKFAEVDLIFNNQLIAERQVKYFETQQKYQASAYKLSLFLRNATGQPMVATEDWLPKQFPVVEPIRNGDLQTDIANALSRRPEPRLLQLEIRRLQYDVQLANNNLLPRVDFITDASQDVGEPTSSKNDKGQFELNVGLMGEVPIQRRKAFGKLQQSQAKIGQVTEKLRLQSDKISIELQTAFAALQWTAQRVEQSEVALRAAYETLIRYRFAFDRGKADLIYINLLESKVNETEIKLIEAQRDWFAALADMQAALGLDPLDQAVQVSSLPKSIRPGPNNLPEVPPLDPAKMQQDWQLHQQPNPQP